MNKKLSRILAIVLISVASSSQAQIITTIAGDGIAGFAGDGLIASYSRFNKPMAVAVDDSGNIYISDFNNQRIRKVNTYGFMSTIAGTGLQGGSGDGGQAKNAKLFSPAGMTLDKGHKNLYIADSKNHRIRKINFETGVISTVAGNGTAGFNGDTIQAMSAKLNLPMGVALDDAGNMYIADAENNRVRKVDVNGIITTLAGTGAHAFGGENVPARTAILNRPQNVAVAPNGDVYIADSYNNRVRKVNSAGIITTVAGSSFPKFGGDGGAAGSSDLNFPTSIAFDRKGNTYITDAFNNRVRYIDPNGLINTLAGDGRSISGTDGGPAADAQINGPLGVAIDSNNNIYVTEISNNLRFIYNGPVNEEPITIFPNPGKEQVSVVLASSFEELATMTIINQLGQRMYNIIVPTNRVVAVKFDIPGTYYLSAISKHKKWSGKAIMLH
ncbi:MAG: NHL repeat-containing protein [Bacteroidota bacterium]